LKPRKTQNTRKMGAEGDEQKSSWPGVKLTDSSAEIAKNRLRPELAGTFWGLCSSGGGSIAWRRPSSGRDTGGIWLQGGALDN